MNVFHAIDMARLDQYAIEEKGIPQDVLMERASLGVVKYILEKNPSSVLICCGGGNNGADGLTVGRILEEKGFSTRAKLLKRPEECKESVQRKYKDYINAGGKEFDESEALEFDLIVDAVYGVGFSGTLKESAKAFVEFINHKAIEDHSFVVAVDMPSGIDTDTGAAEICVKAELTVTFTALKSGLILPPGRNFAGEIKVESIGIDDLKPEGVCFDNFGFFDEKPKLKLRNPAGNKGTFHRVALIAGSKDMAGALALSAESALRSGCGLLEVFTHEKNREILLSRLPEAIVHTYNDFEDFLKEAENLKRADIIVVGPGLSQSVGSKEIVSYVLNNLEKPLVLDADAINIIAEGELKPALKEYAKKNTVIMTPHPAELSRLTGRKVSELLSDYESAVKETAEEYGIILVGKGQTTLVSDGKSVYFNLSGCDAMATAGSGDVLSGMMGSFAINEESPFMGVCLAVYAHGLAGEAAAEEYGHRGTIAGDIARAIKTLE